MSERERLVREGKVKLAPEWKVTTYGSGTVIVTRGRMDRPWLYVYGPRDEDEAVEYRARQLLARELCTHMNGGSKPDWLKALIRWTENDASCPEGRSITATGPMVTVGDPNALSWVQDNSDAAKNQRARLMDRVFGITGKGK